MILKHLPRFDFSTARSFFCRREDAVYESLSNINWALSIEVFCWLMGNALITFFQPIAQSTASARVRPNSAGRCTYRFKHYVSNGHCLDLLHSFLNSRKQKSMAQVNRGVCRCLIHDRLLYCIVLGTARAGGSLGFEQTHLPLGEAQTSTLRHWGKFR